MSVMGNISEVLKFQTKVIRGMLSDLEQKEECIKDLEADLQDARKTIKELQRSQPESPEIDPSEYSNVSVWSLFEVLEYVLCYDYDADKALNVVGQLRARFSASTSTLKKASDDLLAQEGELAALRSQCSQYQQGWIQLSEAYKDWSRHMHSYGYQCSKDDYELIKKVNELCYACKDE